MAEVFLARQRGLEGFDRLVAVKRILPHLVADREFVAMFLDEARLAAQLRHANAVHIYDFGKVEDHYFIAMEYVDGVTAGSLIQRAAREPLPPALVARIGADACAGLDHAHNLRDLEGRALHLVHRDVSPPNLLLSHDGAVKLVDFGIAKVASSIEHHTRPGVVKGKFAYMSPEQTLGRPLDGRSDVFSLAIVLWEMLTGRPAVPRDDVVVAMRTIRDGQVPPVELVRPDTPPELAAALAGAFARDKASRSSALDFGLALEGFIKGAGGISRLEIAQWLRTRFPRQSLVDDGPSGTRPATVATEDAAALTPEPPAGVPDADLTEVSAPPQLTGMMEPLTGHAPALTRLSAPPPPPPLTDVAVTVQAPPVRPRRRGPWIALGLLATAAAAAATLLAADGSREAAPPPRPAASPAPPPIDAAPLALATLDVSTDPDGARVTVGTRAPRTAPTTLEALEPGAHIVGVELEGHEPVEREITLAPGERRTLVLDLRPIAEPAPPPAPVEIADEPAPKPRVKPRGPGRLTVRSVPVYSVVYAGRRKLGQTPLANIALPPGRHRLRFVSQELGVTVRKTVKIAPGKTTRLTVDLKK